MKGEKKIRTYAPNGVAENSLKNFEKNFFLFLFPARAKKIT